MISVAKKAYLGSLPGTIFKLELSSLWASDIVAGICVIHFVSVPRSLIFSSVYKALSAIQKLSSSKSIACCVFWIISIMLFLSDLFPEYALTKNGKPNWFVTMPRTNLFRSILPSLAWPKVIWIESVPSGASFSYFPDTLKFVVSTWIRWVPKENCLMMCKEISLNSSVAPYL